jgi:hypothetical protein
MSSLILLNSPWPASKPPGSKKWLWFQIHLHPFPGFLAIIMTTPDFKPAVQSFDHLGAAEYGQDLKLPDMIPFDG